MSSNPDIESTGAKEDSDREKPAKPSLWSEVMKGWEWVVFVSRILPRVGGFRAWVRTLYFIVSLLITRLLAQWGIIKPKK